MLLAQLRELMSSPQEVMLCPQTAALKGEPAARRPRRALRPPDTSLPPPLAGVRQLYIDIPQAHGDAGAALRAKEEALASLLSVLSFNQALVFCNQRGWAEALAGRLTQSGFPAAFTCGAWPVASRRVRLLRTRAC